MGTLDTPATSASPAAAALSTMTDVPEAAVAAATDAAVVAAARAGVVLEALDSPADLAAAVALCDSIWVEGSGISVPVLRMLAHGGAYVVGARRDDGTLVGVTVGVFVEPLGKVLHSHITGVDAAAASQGVGRALKLHQRAWARVRGMQAITWTYDPLVARNAYFNLVRLGARPIEYLVDFYGTLGPATVPGQESDRVLVSWDITAAPTALTAPTAHGTSAGATAEREVAWALVGRGDDGQPVCAESPRDATTLLVAVPDDVDALRHQRPELVAAWRLAVRQALAPLIDDGWTAADFTRHGSYVLHRPPPGRPPT